MATELERERQPQPSGGRPPAPPLPLVREPGAIRAIAVRQPTLDDVFLAVTGRQIRDEHARAGEQRRGVRRVHGG